MQSHDNIVDIYLFVIGLCILWIGAPPSVSVRSSSKRGFGLELGIEFEDFWASNWEKVNCQFADGQFACNKISTGGPNSKVMTVNGKIQFAVRVQKNKITA